MILSNQVTPSKEEFVKFIKEYPSGTPITMINILKFKEKADNGTETGKEAYLRYSKNMVALMEKANGKVVWMGNVHQTIIGDYESQPDLLLLVAYPNKESFITMCTTPEYEEISKDRKMALEYGGLMVSTPVG